jgi:hypothetical protein
VYDEVVIETPGVDEESAARGAITPPRRDAAAPDLPLYCQARVLRRSRWSIQASMSSPSQTLPRASTATGAGKSQRRVSW